MPRKGVIADPPAAETARRPGAPSQTPRLPSDIAIGDGGELSLWVAMRERIVNVLPACSHAGGCPVAGGVAYEGLDSGRRAWRVPPLPARRRRPRQLFLQPTVDKNLQIVY